MLCPLCGKPASYLGPSQVSDAMDVECERCGRFRITPEALDAIDSGPERKTLLSGYCRRNSSKKHIVEILSTTVDSLIRELPNYSPPEKLDRLLVLMAENTSRFGETTAFEAERDYPLLIASPEEVDHLIDELVARGHISLGNFSPVLTMRGWEKYQEIRREPPSNGRCFVAMWFDTSMDSIYKTVIESAIAEAGYEPIRIDKFEHVNRIDDEIIGQIRRSRFMVADFTGQRHGVYFEAGMMLGLGRNVIWMCKKEELKESMHFDVRQFNFIGYDSEADGKTKLYNRILALEGEGPLLKHASQS